MMLYGTDENKNPSGVVKHLGVIKLDQLFLPSH